jgi:hypothetical protein
MMYANKLTSDAFTKRETAAEELYIRQEEKAKYVYKALAQATTPNSITLDATHWVG